MPGAGSPRHPSGGPPAGGQAGLQQLRDRGHRQRPSEQISLHERDPVVDQEVELLLALDALGHDLGVAGAGQLDDRAQDGPGRVSAGDVGDQRPVDLDDVEVALTQT